MRCHTVDYGPSGNPTETNTVQSERGPSVHITVAADMTGQRLPPPGGRDYTSLSAIASGGLLRNRSPNGLCAHLLCVLLREPFVSEVSFFFYNLRQFKTI